MNERLDSILLLLSFETSRWRRVDHIWDAFKKAGYGPVAPYLERLAEEGYIDFEESNPQTQTYRLTKKGASLLYDGGFVHKAEAARERRVAFACSALTIIMLAAVLVFISQQWQ